MIKRGRYFITYNCNLSCPHCLSNSGISPIKELEPEDLLPIFKKFREAGMETIGISGGEPFSVFTRTLKAVWILNSLGFKVRVFTNGTYPSELRYKALMDAGCSAFHVSLDGFEWAHEKIRGSGTWSKTIETLKLLKNLGAKVRVVSMITKENIDDVEGFISLIDPLVDEIYLKNINTTVGRAKNLPSTVDIRPLERFCSHPKVVVKEFGLYPTRCDTIAVTPDGSLISCGQIQDYFGNGFTDDIEKVFKAERICRFRDIKTHKNGAGEICCDY